MPSPAIAETTAPEYASPPVAPEPLSSPPRPAPSLVRHALIPASLVICFALVYPLRVAPGWVVAVGIAAVILHLAAPALGRASMARFDRDVIRLLAAGRREGLRARYARALGMRLFAPPALVAERRGLVAAETGRPGRARAAYREALGGYPEDRAPLGVQLGLAHASFALGDDAEAIRRYRAVLRRSGSYPRVARNLAHALARRGESPKEAERLAERALREAGDRPSAETELVRALVHARRGQRGPARKVLARTRDAEGRDVERLREEVEEALEEI
jgi:tetratricopeptide (TPR) repeat protein